jgi:hypothetical protein
LDIPADVALVQVKQKASQSVGYAKAAILKTITIGKTLFIVVPSDINTKQRAC